eukprot:362574-Chlamydomonas_euryale.AAC.1
MSTSGQHITVVGNDGLYVSSDFGESFTQKAASLSSTKTLSGVAMSSDGATQTAVSGSSNAPGSVYVSTNSGATWSASTGGIPNLNVNIGSIAMSADGTVQTVAVRSGFVYVSSNSGASWTQKTTLGTALWNSVAMSSTGATQLVSSTIAVQRSTNSGSTFTQVSTPFRFTNVAMSDDGTTQYGVNRGLYKSTDSGVSFSQLTAPTFVFICTNSDGSIVLGVENVTSKVFLSKNGGDSFTEVWVRTRSLSCVMNGDGTRMVFGTTSGAYMSTDFGSNWSQL